jgi:putative methyltransferase (TIGR04325 family)
MPQYSPIVLFVYKRLNHTRRTIEALLDNSESKKSDLIIYSDAARTAEDAINVRKVRDYISNVDGFRSISIIKRHENFGLSRSIIEGVSEILANNDRVIVLEDDIETSPFFLRFMNEALDRFADDQRIISIHGYVYPTRKPLPDVFFLRGADCWGWATWRRGWSYFNQNGRLLLDELERRNLISQFNFNDTFSYSTMLRDQVNKLNDSWAIRWYASAFLADKLTLYPGRSLVRNIGLDSTGTHCPALSTFDVKISNSPVSLNTVIVEDSLLARVAIEDFFRSVSQRPITLRRLTSNRLLRILRRIAEEWLPPILKKYILIFWSRRKGSPQKTGVITFDGPFETWEEAATQSSGYDTDEILEKVLAATLKVKGGEAVFERDSVLFDSVQYAWPVTAGIMWAAARDSGRLSVVDYGGSLGSSYFQNHEFLEKLTSVRWSIVEQVNFVEAGRKNIEDDRLVFYQTLQECFSRESPNVALLSSILQYIENPYKVLDDLMSSGIEILLVDRTPFHDGDKDIIAVQTVPEAIYNASYPLRIFSRQGFIRYVTPIFRLVCENSSWERFESAKLGCIPFDGLIFERYK